jgi:hypothetical protein
MKVLIVGGLPRQEQLIPLHEYPHLDVRFANKGSKYGLSEDFSKADRVLVMTKFVSHALTDRLDRSKSVLIRGGFGKVKAALANLNDTARALNVESHAAANTPVYHEETDEGDDDMAAKNDFTPLKSAKEGDLLIFKRPPTMTIARWENNIQVARSYYKNTFGRITECEFKDGVAHLLVTKVEEVADGAAKRRGRKPGVPQPRPPKPVVTEAEAAEDMEHDFATARRGAIIATTGQDRQFWMDVYLSAMRNNPGVGAEFHATYANTALDSLRAKLGYA